MSRPRIRSIKPEMFADEAFGTLTPQARLLFIGLITMADDEGRMRALPSAITGHVFPYDDVPLRKLKAWIAELADSGLILVYEAGGLPYAALPGWSKHQRVNRPTSSGLPAPPAQHTLTDVSLKPHGEVTEPSVPRAGAHPGADRKGSDQNPLNPPQAGGHLPPAKPLGNRKTEATAYQQQFAAWSDAHFPGCQHSAVEGLVGWVESRGIAPTPDAVREFVAAAPNFAHVLEPAA